MNINEAAKFVGILMEAPHQRAAPRGWEAYFLANEAEPLPH